MPAVIDSYTQLEQFLGLGDPPMAEFLNGQRRQRNSPRPAALGLFLTNPLIDVSCVELLDCVCLQARKFVFESDKSQLRFVAKRLGGQVWSSPVG
jgi:hypothetical protein